jgi:hypothetical protein
MDQVLIDHRQPVTAAFHLVQHRHQTIIGQAEQLVRLHPIDQLGDHPAEPFDQGRGIVTGVRILRRRCLVDVDGHTPDCMRTPIRYTRPDRREIPAI